MRTKEEPLREESIKGKKEARNMESHFVEYPEYFIALGRLQNKDDAIISSEELRQLLLLEERG